MLTALQVRFCVLNKINPSKQKAELASTLSRLEEIAFENSMANRYAFSMDEELERHRDVNLLKYGVILPCDGGGELRQFSSQLLQDYLAASFLTRIDAADLPRYLQQLTRDAHLQQVLLFYCGLQTTEYEQTALTQLFSALCDNEADGGERAASSVRPGDDDAASTLSVTSRLTDTKDPATHTTVQPSSTGVSTTPPPQQRAYHRPAQQYRGKYHIATTTARTPPSSPAASV